MYTESQPTGVDGLGAVVQSGATALMHACFNARDAILRIGCTSNKHAAAQLANSYVEAAITVFQTYGSQAQQLYAIEAWHEWQGYNSGNMSRMFVSAALFHCLGQGTHIG